MIALGIVMGTVWTLAICAALLRVERAVIRAETSILTSAALLSRTGISPSDLDNVRRQARDPGSRTAAGLHPRRRPPGRSRFTSRSELAGHLRSIAAELKASREPRGAMEALRSLQAFAEAMEQRASKKPSFYEAAGAYGDMAAQIRARIRRIEGAGGEA